jgi:hypothetical protein
MLVRISKSLPKGLSLLNGVRQYVEDKAGFTFKGGLFVPRHNNVLAVLGVGAERFLIPGHNIVTDAGDIFYSQKATGAAATNAFANLVLGTGKTAAWAKNGAPSQYGNLTGPIAASNKAVSASYPMAPDTDTTNNPVGAGGSGNNVISWKFSYAAADFTQTGTNITDGVVTIAAPVSGSPLLCGFTFTTAFTKASTDTLLVFVNHQLLGS